MRERSADSSVRRAYAVLGLPPGTVGDELRKRHRALVRRWHPDQYLSDPVGQVEAAGHMREVNAAYQTILSSLAESRAQAPESEEPWQGSARAASSVSHTHTGGRPSRAEVDSLIDAIRAAGALRPIWGDPWNRASVIVACAWSLLFFLFAWRVELGEGILYPALPLILLPRVWWGAPVTRVIAGVFFLVFTLVLPGLVVYLSQ